MPRGAPLFDDVAGVHGTTAAFEKVANAEDGDLEMSDGAIRARAASASVASPSSGISGRSDDAGMGGKTSTSSSRAEVHVDGMGDDDDDETFSWRKFAKFLGPGFLMCIGYVDPGNFESDLQAGCLFGYSLLWVILWATACGLFIQALAVRLALATGWHLSRVMRDEYSNPARYALWFITELAIVASDVPEVIGTALALKLLFGIPTVIGVAITSASTLVFLLLQQLGVRKLEAFMGSLVGVIAACFVAEMGLLGGGDGEEVMEGVVVPRIRDGNALFIAISLLGAVVMPHNLFLHSALVLSRRFRMGEKPLRTALKYNVLESACALAVTLVINFAVVIVAAQTIDDPSISDERRQEIIDRPLQNAPDMLKHALGSSAKILFAVALLASGQSSTITGTYAGQFVMEGFLELKINPVLRAFLTRSAAIIPSLLVCIIAGDEHAETLIVVSSVILFFQLPFALIPLVKFCAAENVMGAMRISNRLAIFTRVLAFVIVLANMTLVVQSIHASGLVNASVGGVFLGVFVALSSLAYCASLLALSLRPVMQNLTPMVAKRLQATETLEYESEYEARGDGGGKGLLEDLEY